MGTFKVIVGLGKTGLSCARYLSQKKIDFVVMDSRENPPEKENFQRLFPQMPLYLGKFPQTVIQAAEEVIVSPGVSPAPFPLEKCCSDIELFAREAKAPIVAITGTNAKGTVTTLVGEMIKTAGLEVAVGGNIGTPALDLLTHPTPDFYVLEVSSFQLETTRYLPLKVATILNISPDHFDRHKTLENYCAVKQRIYTQAEIAIFNREDAHTFPPSSCQACLSFGLEPTEAPNFGIVDRQLGCGKEAWMPLDALKIQGQHNYLNALAAFAIGKSLDLPPSKMIEALAHFPGLPHRCEWIGACQNIHWYNDSKGTNVGATLAALHGLGQSVKGKIILIAGGVGKGADFQLLQSAVQQYVRQLILIGQDALRIASALSAYAPVVFAQNLQEAVEQAAQAAKAHDVVLFSPACASFDMFRDFEDRGGQFKTAVEALLRKHGRVIL